MIVLVLRNQHKSFGGKLTKMGLGVCQLGGQNFNAGFVKPTPCNIFLIFCLMFLIDAIKYNVEKKIQNLFYFFTRLFGGASVVLCFLAATRTLFKPNEK